VERLSVPRSLTVVIPALNEEAAIGATIERCLGAQMILKEHSSIEELEVVVVSDGSVDRTVDIAQSYEDISVIVCENNHGYGAAIKRGFEKGTGDLLGFLDADGTCDPNFFVDLCNMASETPADVVLGTRMNKMSEMPAVRRLGNQMYALLMSYLSGRRITDTASGMRVIRKDALPKLYPLPDGLHFTPAMTCRALLHNDLTIREIPMPYHERLGTSKLNVFKDGFRFLLAITDIALTYRPLKFFGGAAAFLFLVAFLYGLGPLFTYLAQRAVPNSFIYRLLAVNTLILAGLMLLTIGIVAERVAASLNGGVRKHTFIGRFLLSFCSTKNMLLAGPVVALIGIALNFGTILDYLTTWHISFHWVYVSTGALLILSGMQLAAVGVFERLIETILTKERGKK
jgi:glycosyltransferase involved in cell wall biosynthesis